MYDVILLSKSKLKVKNKKIKTIGNNCKGGIKTSKILSSILELDLEIIFLNFFIIIFAKKPLKIKATNKHIKKKNISIIEKPMIP